MEFKSYKEPLMDNQTAKVFWKKGVFKELKLSFGSSTLNDIRVVNIESMLLESISEHDYHLEITFKFFPYMSYIKTINEQIEITNRLNSVHEKDLFYRISHGNDYINFNTSIALKSYEHIQYRIHREHGHNIKANEAIIVTANAIISSDYIEFSSFDFISEVNDKTLFVEAAPLFINSIFTSDVPIPNQPVSVKSKFISKAEYLVANQNHIFIKSYYDQELQEQMEILSYHLPKDKNKIYFQLEVFDPNDKYFINNYYDNIELMFNLIPGDNGVFMKLNKPNTIYSIKTNDEEY